MTVTLEQPARALLVTAEDREVPVPASLRYSSDDPLAVHLDFPADIALNGDMVTWTFSRALLEEGVRARPAPAMCTSGPAAGSVRWWSCTPRTAWPCSEFEKPRSPRFLLRSYAVVAAGREDVGPALDRGLTSLLGECLTYRRISTAGRPRCPRASPSVPSGTKRTSAPVSRHRSTISSTMSSRASRSPLSAGTRWSVPPVVVGAHGHPVVLLDGQQLDAALARVLPDLVDAGRERPVAAGRFELAAPRSRRSCASSAATSGRTACHTASGVPCARPPCGMWTASLVTAADLVEQGQRRRLPGDVQRPGLCRAARRAHRGVDVAQELAGVLVTEGARQIADPLLALGVEVLAAPGQREAAGVLLGDAVRRRRSTG